MALQTPASIPTSNQHAQLQLHRLSFCFPNVPSSFPPLEFYVLTIAFLQNSLAYTQVSGIQYSHFLRMASPALLPNLDLTFFHSTLHFSFTTQTSL
jgi:hypothetical protein